MYIDETGEDSTSDGVIIVEGHTDCMESDMVTHDDKEVLDDDNVEGVCKNVKVRQKAMPKQVRKSSRKRNAPERL